MEEIVSNENKVEVVDVQFRPGQKVYYFSPGKLRITTGSHLIIETSRGPEYGTCTAGNHFIPEKDVVAPLRSVLRLATQADRDQLNEVRAKEKKAYQVCMEKIAEHGLDMQLVSAEYAFDGSKILFFFTADERVDFRELVKNLASIFHTRIELRQIGVRDKAKMVGGLGICGRPFCCAQFLDNFQPVSIKMAKTQNLSLNPTKISGTCGRLMCCLKYEQDTYEALIKSSPKAESFVDTPDGRGTIIDVSLLKQSVKVRMEDNPETVGCYHNCDICVLRSGKAKKNDPPIPADLAPISGNGKRAKREEPKEEGFLEPVKFRYRTEAVVEEPEIPEIPEEQPEEVPAESSGRSRRRRRRGEKAEAVRAAVEEVPQEEAPVQQTLPEESGEKRSRNRRRRRGGERKNGAEAPKTEEQPKAEASEGAAPNSEGNRNRRRRPHHRRKPKAE